MFESNKNYNNIFLRCTILGLLNQFRNKISWTNVFSDENVVVNIPFYYKLYGSQRFLLDAFVDDIPDKRVELNIDKVPRTMVTLKNWSFKTGELSNPNIWLKTFIETVDDEKNTQLQQVIAQTKAMPTLLTYEIKSVFSSEVDLMRYWEEFAIAMQLYKFFDFEYKRMRINAVIQLPEDNEYTMPTEGDLKDDTVISLVSQLQIHTFFPIFDLANAQPYNKRVRWTNKIYDNQTLKKQQEDINKKKKDNDDGGIILRYPD